MHLQYYREAQPNNIARQFIRRIIYCDIPEPITVNVPAPPTGYNHIGWAMRGSGAKITETSILPVQEGEVHFAGQTVRTAARIILQGRVRHILAELTPTGLFMAFGLLGEPLVNQVSSARLSSRGQLQQMMSRVSPDSNMEDALMLFQQALISQNGHGEVPDYVTMAAGLIEESKGLVPMSELVKGVGERQLQRNFKRIVGCSPKYFAQVLRINATIISLVERRDENLADVAAHHGFSDQSHMVRTIQTFFGHAPSDIRGNVDMLLRAFPTSGITAPDTKPTARVK